MTFQVETVTETEMTYGDLDLWVVSSSANLMHESKGNLMEGRGRLGVCMANSIHAVIAQLCGAYLRLHVVMINSGATSGTVHDCVL